MFNAVTRWIQQYIPQRAKAQAVGLTLFSPANFQVFQRDPILNDGKVLLAGQVDGLGAVTVEYRVNGGDWLELATNVDFRFSLDIMLDAGQYTIDMRAGAYTLTRNYVGVGDVFVIMGQSNASGRGQIKQVYSHPTLKASLHSNAYAWGELLDWTDSPLNALFATSNDGTTTSAYGSYWPLLATLIMQHQGCPVAFIPCAKGGTIINQWLPSKEDRYDTATLYGAMLHRVFWSGDKVRAVLWHQGESNAGNPSITPAGIYYQLLKELSQDIALDLQCPLIAATVSQQTALPAIRTWAVNRGIEMAASDPFSNVKRGADLADILPDDAAQQHITSSAKLQLCADRWFIALLATLYAV